MPGAQRLSGTNPNKSCSAPLSLQPQLAEGIEKFI